MPGVWPGFEATQAREMVVVVRFGEHVYALSFNADEGAEAFSDWWAAIGQEQFEEWAESRRADYI